MNQIHEETLHIFVGFDQVESVAYHTLCHSILSRASMPIAFHPIKQSLLKNIYTRKHDPKQSNEFSFSRFFVPYLMGFRGWAVFMDLDMLFRKSTDIKELYELRDESKAVLVCKHEYKPTTSTKYLGTVQYPYPRKNWSSFMLFNCDHRDCRKLTPNYINTAPALDLHRFKWTDDESIGELPLEWNWLVGEYKYNPKAKNVHFTIGGPYFEEYSHCDYSDEWFTERSLMLHALQLHEVKTKVSER